MPIAQYVPYGTLVPPYNGQSPAICKSTLFRLQMTYEYACVLIIKPESYDFTYEDLTSLGTAQQLVAAYDGIYIAPGYSQSFTISETSRIILAYYYSYDGEYTDACSLVSNFIIQYDSYSKTFLSPNPELSYSVPTTFNIVLDSPAFIMVGDTPDPYEFIDIIAAENITHPVQYCLDNGINLPVININTPTRLRVVYVDFDGVKTGITEDIILNVTGKPKIDIKNYGEIASFVTTVDILIEATVGVNLTMRLVNLDLCTETNLNITASPAVPYQLAINSNSNLFLSHDGETKLYTFRKETADKCSIYKENSISGLLNKADTTYIDTLDGSDPIKLFDKGYSICPGSIMNVAEYHSATNSLIFGTHNKCGVTSATIIFSDIGRQPSLVKFYYRFIGFDTVYDGYRARISMSMEGAFSNNYYLESNIDKEGWFIHQAGNGSSLTLEFSAYTSIFSHTYLEIRAIEVIKDLDHIVFGTEETFDFIGCAYLQKEFSTHAILSRNIDPDGNYLSEPCVTDNNIEPTKANSLWCVEPSYPMWQWEYTYTSLGKEAIIWQREISKLLGSEVEFINREVIGKITTLRPEMVYFDSYVNDSFKFGFLGSHLIPSNPSAWELTSDGLKTVSGWFSLRSLEIQDFKSPTGSIILEYSIVAGYVPIEGTIEVKLLNRLTDEELSSNSLSTTEGFHSETITLDPLLLASGVKLRIETRFTQTNNFSGYLVFHKITIPDRPCPILDTDVYLFDDKFELGISRFPMTLSSNIIPIDNGFDENIEYYALTTTDTFTQVTFPFESVDGDAFIEVGCSEIGGADLYFKDSLGNTVLTSNIDLSSSVVGGVELTIPLGIASVTILFIKSVDKSATFYISEVSVPAISPLTFSANDKLSLVPSSDHDGWQWKLGTEFNEKVSQGLIASLISTDTADLIITAPLEPGTILGLNMNVITVPPMDAQLYTIEIYINDILVRSVTKDEYYGNLETIVPNNVPASSTIRLHLAVNAPSGVIFRLLDIYGVLQPELAISYSPIEGIVTFPISCELQGKDSGVVKYTLDGTNPLYSNTAQTYTAPVEITENKIINFCLEGSNRLGSKLYIDNASYNTSNIYMFKHIYEVENKTYVRFYAYPYVLPLVLVNIAPDGSLKHSIYDCKPILVTQPTTFLVGHLAITCDIFDSANEITFTNNLDQGSIRLFPIMPIGGSGSSEYPREYSCTYGLISQLESFTKALVNTSQRLIFNASLTTSFRSNVEDPQYKININNAGDVDYHEEDILIDSDSVISVTILPDYTETFTFRKVSLTPGMGFAIENIVGNQVQQHNARLITAAPKLEQAFAVDMTALDYELLKAYSTAMTYADYANYISSNSIIALFADESLTQPFPFIFKLILNSGDRFLIPDEYATVYMDGEKATDYSTSDLVCQFNGPIETGTEIAVVSDACLRLCIDIMDTTKKSIIIPIWTNAPLNTYIASNSLSVQLSTDGISFHRAVAINSGKFYAKGIMGSDVSFGDNILDVELRVVSREIINASSL